MVGATKTVVDAMLKYLDQHQDWKDNIEALFNYEHKRLDWASGKGAHSARKKFGTLENFFADVVTLASQSIQPVVSDMLDRALWTLLSNIMLAMYVDRCGTLEFSNSKRTKVYTFSQAGEKYQVVWAGLIESSFCAWCKDYTFIKFKVVLPYWPFTHYSEKVNLAEVNQIKVKIEANKRVTTKPGTMASLTAKSGTFALTTYTQEFLDKVL